MIPLLENIKDKWSNVCETGILKILFQLSPELSSVSLIRIQITADNGGIRNHLLKLINIIITSKLSWQDFTA